MTNASDMELRLLKIINDEVVDTGVTRPIQDLEKCVRCGELTNVPKDTPIAEREFYVEGYGQLHSSCYEMICILIRDKGNYPIEGKSVLVLA